MVSEQLKEKLTKIAISQLRASREFKAPRLKQLEKFVDAYNGRVKEKLRVTFNVPFPVFSGLVDTLLADFDDPISLQFKENDPADYSAIRKVNACWLGQKDSLDTDLMWDMKLRWDRMNALMTGRGIQKFFCESDPEFKQVFKVIHLADFEFEPRGGGHLENHLFHGESGLEKSEDEITSLALSGYYDQSSVDKLITTSSKTDYKPDKEQEFLQAFRSLGLDPSSNNYVGSTIHYLCDWIMTYEGKRYSMVFDPWTQVTLRCELLEDMTDSNLSPYTSWATHEDQKNFMSKAYGDDFYAFHETIGTLVNQELTNRAKQNMNARAYDPEMWPDIAKLDKASYRPDSLVPFDSLSGTRKVSDGIYEFKTAELKGTIDLVNWLESALAKDTGVTEIQSAGAGKGKANVQYSLLQQAQKRLSFKAHSYSQCYTEIGLRYLWGLREHMPSALMVQLSGVDGYGWDELKKGELNFNKKPNVKIINQTEQDKMNVLGKDQKIQAITNILGNEVLMQQNNPRKLNEIVLRDVGGWNDQDIFELMDTQSFASKDVMTEADIAIQSLVRGKKPELCYVANIAFLQKIYNFEKTHRNTLGQEKSQLFHEYIIELSPIAMENMVSLAVKMKSAQTGQPQPGSAMPQDSGGQQQPQPTESPISNQNINSQMTPQVLPMAVGGGQQ